MVEVDWVKFRSFSGAKIHGTKKFELTDDTKNLHMWRAAWLTAQIEGGGVFGAIQSYDGAGLSAGLEHRIAVFPRNMEQGTLWGLLRRLEKEAHCDELKELWERLRDKAGWYIDRSGKLRDYNNGRLISGKEIRNEFAPHDGRVPRRGEKWEQAKQWAIAFHNLFAAEKTHPVQVEALIDSLADMNGKEESEAYRKAIGNGDFTQLKYEEDIPADLDLALCVYHSYSVNAPGMARKRFRASRPDGSKEWAHRLIWTLATTDYGRWSDTYDNRNRYDATRIRAQRSGYWPDWLFEGRNAIMPKNF